MVSQQTVNLFRCYPDIKETSVMTKADILHIMQVLPCPILGSQFTVHGILLTDVITSVVTNHIGHLLLEPGHGAPYMDRGVNIILIYPTRFMAERLYGR